MQRFLCAAAILLATAPAFATDVGVSVTVDQPGFYGSIDIGNTRPQVINTAPVIIQPVIGVEQRPIYMHVPPGHARKWARYCHSYHACGRPVYFVKEEWYRDSYEPTHRGHGHREHGRDRDYDHDHGHGHGHGKGHRD